MAARACKPTVRSSAQPARAPRSRSASVCLAAVAALAIAASVAGCGGGLSTAEQASTYVRAHASAVARIRAAAADARVVAALENGDPTPADIRSAQVLAQRGQDVLAAVAPAFAPARGRGQLTTFEGDVAAAVQTLRQTLASAASPAAPLSTLLHLSGPYAAATVLWNLGVGRIWQLAGRRSAPTLPTI